MDQVLSIGVPHEWVTLRGLEISECVANLIKAIM